MRKIRELVHLLRSYYEDKRICKSTNVKLFNFCYLKEPNDIWLHNFVKNEYPNLLAGKENPLSIFSVYGPRGKVHLNRSSVKVFFTSENIDYYPHYSDHCLKDVDLALGFEYLDDPNYLRFPLWLVYFMPSKMSLREISAAVQSMSVFDYQRTPRRKFCSLVSSHDSNGLRGTIFNALSGIAPIDCAGAFLNNTNSLKEEFNDQKRPFLTQYKFNICPENSNCEGYVTEKIFEAVNSGCIPIYWGSNNNPEPEVLNKDAILFFNDEKDLSELQQRVLDLYSKESLYKEFIQQERFLPTAGEFIADTLSDLHSRLDRLLKQ